jgi:hypothetical protein
VDAAEIRVRAERRLGETLTAQPKATGGELHLYQCGKQTFNRRLFWNTEGPQMADSRLTHRNKIKSSFQGVGVGVDDALQ